MIRISINTIFLAELLKQYSHKIEAILPIHKIKLVPPEIKFFFTKSIVGINLEIPVKVSFRSDNSDLLMDFRVPAGLLEQLASAAAAKVVAEKLGCKSHGSTVIYPLEKYLGGLTLNLTNEHLSIIIRPKE